MNRKKYLVALSFFVFGFVYSSESQAATFQQFRELGIFRHNDDITVSLRSDETQFVIKKYDNIGGVITVWFDDYDASRSLNINDYCDDNYCAGSVHVWATDGDGGVTGYSTREGNPDPVVLNFGNVNAGCELYYSILDDAEGSEQNYFTLNTGSGDQFFHPTPKGDTVQNTGNPVIIPQSGVLKYKIFATSIGVDDIISCFTGPPPPPPPGDEAEITGFIWDATGLECNASNATNAANRFDLGTEVSPNITIEARRRGVTLGIDTIGSNGRYRFTNVPIDTNYVVRLIVDPFSHPGFPTSSYNLKCANGVGSFSRNPFVAGPFEARYTMGTGDPSTVHLGFELIPGSVLDGWFTILDGDVFAGINSGGTEDSINSKIPDSGDILGDFGGYLIDGDGTAFAGDNINVQTDFGNSRINSSNTFAEQLRPDGSSWPANIDYEIPASATQITSCSSSLNLSTDQSYWITYDCLNDALTTGNYTVNSVDGGRIAVVYVQGNDPLSQSVLVENNFQSANDNRILFISQVPIIFDNGFGVSGNPSTTTRANVEAAFITNTYIRFEGTTDSIASPDLSLVVEGPLVVGDATSDGSILFNRDGGANNGYPSVIVRYNPDYLIYLTSQERNSLQVNYTGSAVIDVIWEEVN